MSKRAKSAVTPLAVGRGAGVHWFVAWRYLLSNERKLSRPITSIMAMCLWDIAGFGAVAAFLYPLASPVLSAYQPLPWWLLTAVGLAVVGAVVAPFVSGRALSLLGLHDLRLRRRSKRIPKAVIVEARTAPAPYSLIAGLSSGIIAINLLGLFWFLHRPFTEPPVEPIPTGLIVAGGIGAFLIVLLLPNILPWYLRIRRELRGKKFSIDLKRDVAIVVLGISVATLLLAIATSYWGLRYVLLPARDSVSMGKLIFAVGVGLIASGPILLIALRASGRELTGAQWWALRLAVLGVAILAVLGIWHLRALAIAGLPPTTHVQVKLPTAVTLPALVGFAVFILGGVLLGIRYLFTFFSTVSIGGVAIGSMALVIVLSVMAGFENDLRRKILGSNAHVLVTKATDKPLVCRAVPNLSWRRCVLEVEPEFTEYRRIGKKVDKVSDVVASSPYLISEVVIAANNNYANVIIKGVEPETVGAVGELDENVKLENGKPDPNALKRLWPLAEDGTPIGKPDDEDEEEGWVDEDTDGDGFSDALPDDPEPLDLSGGATDADAGTPDGNADPNEELDQEIDEAIENVLDSDGPPKSDKDAGATGRAIPLTPFPPMVGGTDDSGDFDDDGNFIRRIPPLVAILPGTLVGKELRKQINLFPGQEVKVVSPLGQDTPLGPVPRTKRFRVAGEFFTGMYEYDLKFIYVEYGALQDFLDLGDEVTGIEVRVKDPANTGKAVAGLRSALGPEYRIQDWKELNRSLFSALKLEKIAMFLVLAIIILVASFSIVGNLIMVVVEKAREIAVLKTLGTSDLGIMKIFITQGFFIGLVGTSIGVVLGLAASIAMQTFGLPLDPDVYYIDRLPIHIEPLSVALVFAAGIFISVVATLYPAYVAARMRPVNGLRYE